MNAMKLFSWFTKPQRDLDDSIDSLHQSVKVYAQRCVELTARNDYLQERVNHLENLEKDLKARETSIASYAVDFKLLNAFSIEREFRDNEVGTPVTVIGWLNKDGHSQEWYFDCNQDAHEQLVKDFIAYKQSK